MQDAPEQLKLDWLVQTAEKNVHPLVLNTVKENNDLGATLANLGTTILTSGNDATPRKRIELMQSSGWRIEPHQVTAFFLKNSNRKSFPEARNDRDKLLPLISKLHPNTFRELRSNPSLRPLTDNYSDLEAALHGKVQEDWADRNLG